MMHHLPAPCFSATDIGDATLQLPPLTGAGCLSRQRELAFQAYSLACLRTAGNRPFPVAQRARRKRGWHGTPDELVNAIRMSRSVQPHHGGSPVVANDVRCVDNEPVKSANRIADGVLQRIRSHSFRAIGTLLHMK
jgi:hypothetical protein